MAMSFGTNQFAKLVARDAQAPIHGDVLFFSCEVPLRFLQNRNCFADPGVVVLDVEAVL
jgi:hypothetical protein